MEKKDISVITRRDFIRRAACAAVGTAAMTSAIRDLRFMNAAVAQSNIGPNDYKALVCIFLAGGNDSNNLIIPTIPTEYNNYAAIRTTVLAIPQSSIAQSRWLQRSGGSYVRPASGLPGTQAAFHGRQTGDTLQHRHAGLSVDPGSIQHSAVPKTAAAFLARRSGHAMADLHSRPAAGHRLGRTLRGPVELSPAQSAHFAFGFTGRREHV